MDHVACDAELQALRDDSKQISLICNDIINGTHAPVHHRARSRVPAQRVQQRPLPGERRGRVHTPGTRSAICTYSIARHLLIDPLAAPSSQISRFHKRQARHAPPGRAGARALTKILSALLWSPQRSLSLRCVTRTQHRTERMSRD